MKKSLLALMIVALFFVSSASILWLYTSFVIEDIRTVPMYLEVGKTMGMNADTDAIQFGRVIRGGFSARKIDVSHKSEWVQEVIISTYGNISEWVEVEPSRFELERDEIKIVKIRAAIPENAEFGNYTGHIRVLFRKKII